ncbi:MAG: class I SAM-dependent methyltransferase [Acidimicrobiales bacterium]
MDVTSDEPPVAGRPATVARRLQRLLTDDQNPRSFASRARSARWTELHRRFPALADMRVLDLGGLPQFWQAVPVRPTEVTTVNLEPAAVDEPWHRHVVDDACDPQSIRHERFDLVVSNSLLEHVGGFSQRQKLGDVIHAAAPRHWVQTPYRYFPVEPHWACPALQFLPVALRAAVVRRWPLGHARTTDHGASVSAVLWIDLLSLTEMRLLFPDSEIWRERALGITKSIVAVRTTSAESLVGA